MIHLDSGFVVVLWKRLYEICSECAFRCNETLLSKRAEVDLSHASVARAPSWIRGPLLVQNAVSMYCRLGFAVKKGQVISQDQLHLSWRNVPCVNRLK